MNSVGPAVCMKLIEAGANPTRTDSLYGRTALHWAILMEADELKSVVQVLLGRERSTGTASAIRVNVNEVDHDPGLGATALHYAIETQAEDSVIDELLKAGVDSGDWNKAADEMVDSGWYRQVTNRAQRLVDRMRLVNIV